MSNQEQTNQEDLKNFKQLWQQSTTNQSIKLKEREMLREIQYDMDSFDEKYGFGTTKQLILSGVISVLMIIVSIKQTNPMFKAIFLLLSVLHPAHFLFQLWTRFEKRRYDVLDSVGFYEYSLERVKRQMLWMKLSAGFLFGGLATIFAGFWDELSTDKTYYTFFALAMIVGVGYMAWQYRYRLMPLHNRLHDALFDIRNPYSSQNDEQH